MFRFRSAIIFRKIFLAVKNSAQGFYDTMALIKPFCTGSPSTCTLTSSPNPHPFSSFFHFLPAPALCRHFLYIFFMKVVVLFVVHQYFTYTGIAKFSFILIRIICCTMYSTTSVRNVNAVSASLNFTSTLFTPTRGPPSVSSKMQGLTRVSKFHISILSLRGFGEGKGKDICVEQFGTDNLLEVGVFEHFN